MSARALAFGMKVIAHDPFVPAARAQSLGVHQCSLTELLENADVLTLHVPLTGQTRGIIGAEALTRMKPSSVLINCARGGVVDEDALLGALDAGTIRAAAIDVVAQEPPATASAGARLHAHPKVLATPHLGGSTFEALDRIATELAQDVADALRGKPAAGAVNAPAPSGADAQRVRAYMDAADRLGRLLPQLFGDAVAGELRMHLAGELAGAQPDPLRNAFLAAFLQTTTERRVSIVNAQAVAGELGVLLEVVNETVPPAFSSLMTIWAGDHRIAATVLPGGPRIVQIDGFELDAIPQGAWIVTHHEDVPGMVGRVGTLLGQAGVNIATMQVARDPQADCALMVLAVDRAPSLEHMQAMRSIIGMQRVDLAVL